MIIVLGTLAILGLLSACVVQTTPSGYDVVYRVTKDAAAFVNSVQYRDGSDVLRTVNNPALPWEYRARFPFGAPLYLAADADGSASAAATLEVTATRASGGTASIDQTAVCSQTGCTYSSFYISATLSTSAVVTGLGTD